jgi:hypothetical protein
MGGAFGVSRTILEPAITLDTEGNFEDQNFDMQNFGEPGSHVSVQIGTGRSISEPSVDVSDSLSAIRGASRAISEPAVDVSDSLSKMSAFQRTITEAAIAISDSVSRGQAYTRDLVEAAINVLDSLTGLKGISRTSRRSPRTSKRTGTGKAPKRNSGDVST